MKARLAAAGLFPLREPSGPPAPHDSEEGLTSARVTAARARARERQDRQRQLLRPLGWALIAVVVTAGINNTPAPGLTGAGLGVSLALAVYAVAVAATVAVGWARRGYAVQLAMIGLIGGCGIALAALQPHGPAELAASVAVWIAAVRLPLLPGIVAGGVITGALALTIAATQHPAAQPALYALLLCLLLAVTGHFIRRGRESQDRTELLMAQLQDAREAEAAAAALAERSRIAGELHDVLAHALSGLAIQLQGARKLADRESVSAGLRGALERSAELAREGLGDARQAVGALRGDRLPTVDQVGTLVEDFRRDTGAVATLRIDGTPRALPADASLALFRGAQEALTNIARYAPGTTVAVTVRYGTGHTVLAVEDRRCPSVAADAGDATPGATAGAGNAEPGATEGAKAIAGVVGADAKAAAADAATVGRDAAAGADARTVGGDARRTGALRADAEEAEADRSLLAEAGGGHGLTAMRERTARAGGAARAGPTAEGWLVELEVPG
jgi:signal transduction histidine kinase